MIEAMKEPSASNSEFAALRRKRRLPKGKVDQHEECVAGTSVVVRKYPAFILTFITK